MFLIAFFLGCVLFCALTMLSFMMYSLAVGVTFSIFVVLVTAIVFSVKRNRQLAILFYSLAVVLLVILALLLIAILPCA